MKVNLSLFQELYNNGLFALPIIWDTENKQATAHPEHDINQVTMSMQYVEALLQNGFNKSNGIALKLVPPYGMLDFDLKNSKDKTIYTQWLQHIESSNTDVLRKVVIESTRSGGYHVYIKYKGLDRKIAIAKSEEGLEVISVYTGALLSYTYPTPGYTLIHNDFNDLDYLTTDEFDLLTTTAALFNQSPTHKPGDKLEPIIYPPEYETLLLQFDTKCTDEVFDTILRSIDLYPAPDPHNIFKNKKYSAYLRKGSNAAYSAKAYFTSKRLLIFSASMSKYPTWHDSDRQGENKWVLSPSKIIYYKNDKNWLATIDEIKLICDSACIEIVEQQPVTKQVLPIERMRFPYDIFPDVITNFMHPQVLQHEYLSGAILAATSVAVGNTVELHAMDGYKVKPILYLAIVAPPGASKTPAIKKAFAPLEEYDSKAYKQYTEQLKEYKIKLAEAKRDKQPEPERPLMHQILIKDSTIEMVVKILSFNQQGCCIVADELSGFLARMNQYKDGDEVQKWLEMWSGASILLQRITRDENKVEEPYCSIIGGIQPGVLESLSKDDNQHNGFYHRFLFVYPEPKPKNDWQPVVIPGSVKFDFFAYFNILIKMRAEEKQIYYLEPDAEALYKQWHDNKNKKYNIATSDTVKGIIAKYQDYCLRFAILLQVMHDGAYRPGTVSANNVERAIRLTEYFLANMHKAIKILSPETPVDKLQAPYDKLYAALPVTFSLKNAIKIGIDLGLKEATVKTFFIRNKDLFIQPERGIYEKIY